LKKLAFIILVVLVASSSAGYGQKKSFASRSNVSGGIIPRLINITELNGGLGYYTLDRDYSKRFISLTSVFGSGLAKYFTGGIGAGVSLYDDGTLFPLFADFRYFFILGQMRVFILGDAGILISSTRKVGETVLFVSPGVGITLPLGDNLSASLGQDNLHNSDRKIMAWEKAPTVSSMSGLGLFIYSDHVPRFKGNEF